MTLRELLGAATPGMPAVKAALLDGFAARLGIEPHAGAITQQEEALARQLFAEEIGTDEFVDEIDDRASAAEMTTASARGAGGAIEAHVRMDNQRIREVLITGDFFVTPPRTILDLEASLRGVRIDEVESSVEAFFAKAAVEALSAEPKRFSDVIRAAAATPASAPKVAGALE